MLRKFFAVLLTLAACDFCLPPFALLLSGLSVGTVPPRRLPLWSCVSATEGFGRQDGHKSQQLQMFDDLKRLKCADFNASQSIVPNAGCSEMPSSEDWQGARFVQWTGDLQQGFSKECCRPSDSRQTLGKNTERYLTYCLLNPGVGGYAGCRGDPMEASDSIRFELFVNVGDVPEPIERQLFSGLFVCCNGSAREPFVRQGSWRRNFKRATSWTSKWPDQLSTKRRKTPGICTYHILTRGSLRGVRRTLS